MWTLTSPISVPNLRGIKLQTVSFDEDNKIAVIEQIVQATGGVLHPQLPFIMVVRNGSIAGALVGNPSPSTLTDVIVQATMTGAGLATAFDGALAAYTGADRRLGLMNFLAGKTGTIIACTQPSLIGTSAPALVAGAGS